ncbi:alpha/beta hydrolase [Micromonospora polyrhachis]|uniref:Acetyl esterase/lipase n=1 Tax=Micromonospora polyrhachis TaxID=1282883 RepID=A0A7W7SQM5_9ACTN|nr:alpha/beta hydrolase [Micromonospora polyrhachis]MBB4959046.1 acetyl esterase/lipase [Micromonospora polyrhachis]
MVADPRSVLTRPAPAPDVTVRYGDQPEQLADLRRPAAPADVPPPLVVVIHGGFWRAEYDRSHTGPLAADLAAQGYPVVQLEYRRTGQPDGGWPGTMADVITGVTTLPALFAAALPEVALAPGGPILLGHSAGGHLALYCAASAPEHVRGVVALAPVADLAEAYRLDLDGGAVAALLGGGPDDLPDRYAAVDPVRRLPIQVPTVLIHGVRDEQVPIGMSRRYVDLARSAGDDVRLVELAGCEHYGLIDPTASAWLHVSMAIRSLSRRR